MKKRTILLCRIDGNFGGVERYILTLARGLDRERFRPVIVAMGQPGELFEQTRASGWDGELLPMSSRMEVVGAAHCLEEIASHWDADLLHTFGLRSNSLAYWLRRSKRLPWIIRLPNINSTDYTNPLRGWISHWMNNWLIRRADALQVISPQLEGYVRRWKKPPQSLYVIPNGVNTNYFDRAQVFQTARDTYHIPANAPVIGSVGRLDPIKGYDILIRAFSKFVSDFPAARLILAGGGPEQARLEQLIRSSKLEGRVHLSGYVQDVRPYLVAMDIFVCSSHSEGVPMAMLEAMAMEVPIVTTRVGGIESIIQERRSGLFIPDEHPEVLADTLKKLILDESCRKSLREESRHQAVTRFSDQRMIHQVQAMYGRILGDEDHG